jgi:lipopolysaccharide/colanic/teichoic acid biosynthesis glycosyltransferase
MTAVLEPTARRDFSRFRPSRGSRSSTTPAARRRLAVKPGLTGVWQVSGRSDLSWDKSTLDLRYVDTWSPLLDATILARTTRAAPRSPYVLRL